MTCPNRFIGLAGKMTEASPLENSPRVLSEAVAKTAMRLGIESEQLAQILGMESDKAARMLSGAYRLDQAGGEWERAQLFIRLFLSLQALIGDDQMARAWIHDQSKDLAGRPIDLVAQKEGLSKVVRYVEARRFQT